MKNCFSALLIPGVTLFIFSMIQAQARLGETAIQCADRYGSPKNDSSTRYIEKSTPLIHGIPEHIYEYKGWRIRAAFFDLTGPAIRVEYQKIITPGSSAIIQDYEAEAVLKAETPDGMTWRPVLYDNPNSPNTGLAKAMESTFLAATGEKTFQRTDGAIARLHIGMTTIRLELPAAQKYEQQLKIQKEQKARESVPQF